MSTQSSAESPISYKLDLDKVQDVVFEDIDVLLQYLNLKYRVISDNVFMACPIHESDNPQSLSISKTKKVWKCWTRGCEEEYGNNIFGFILGLISKEYDNVSFSDALGMVCDIYDVNHLNIDKQRVKAPVITVLKDVETEANYGDFTPVQTCGSSPYFSGRRRFSPSVLKEFAVEDCIDHKSSMYKRSIIPVQSKNGTDVGYIARAIEDYILPKYLYSFGFEKSKHLYNYHRAIDISQEKSCLCLVEGQGDVWRLHEAAVYNCVGLFGKDISPYQRKLLTNTGVTTLVILLDNDQAGREAKIKIQREMSRSFNLVFPRMKSKDMGQMSLSQIKSEILPQIRNHV